MDWMGLIKEGKSRESRMEISPYTTVHSSPRNRIRGGGGHNEHNVWMPRLPRIRYVELLKLAGEQMVGFLLHYSTFSAPNFCKTGLLWV